MAYFVTGDAPVYSTATTATNPSTSALLAQLDSTQLLTINRGGIYQVNAWLGSDTNVLYWVEHCLSTGLGSTAIRQRVPLRTAGTQTSQFVLRFKLEQNDLLRVRASTTYTGDLDAQLAAERLE